MNVEQITVFIHCLKQVVCVCVCVCVRACVKHPYLLAEIEAIILEATNELHTCESEVATPFHPSSIVCVPQHLIVLVYTVEMVSGCNCTFCSTKMKWPDISYVPLRQ